MKYLPAVVFGALALMAVAPPPPPPDLSAGQAGTPSPAASPAASASAAPTETPSLDNLFGGPQKKTASPNPDATPTPPPDDRKGLDGVWEVQIQRGDQTDYTHFNLKQAGTALTGTYLDAAKKRFPIAGSLDGQQVRLVVSMPDGSTVLLEGKLDGTTDMVGMLTDAKERVPFTAAYRPKEKWIDNVNTTPGGLGGQGGYMPPKKS